MSKEKSPLISYDYESLDADQPRKKYIASGNCISYIFVVFNHLQMTKYIMIDCINICLILNSFLFIFIDLYIFIFIHYIFFLFLVREVIKRENDQNHQYILPYDVSSEEESDDDEFLYDKYS